MDNLFLYDENEEIDNDHINENDIIHRRTDIQECVDNRQGIYDISKLINKDVSRENILLSTNDLDYLHDDNQHLSHDSHKLIFDLSLNNLGGLTYKKNVIGFRLNECIYTAPIYNIKEGVNDKIICVNDTRANEVNIKEGFYNINLLLTTINSDPNLAASEPIYFRYSDNDNKIFISGIGVGKTLKETPLLRKLGFHTYSADDTLSTPPPSEEMKADTHPSLIIGTYLDVVVDEVPYGACKQNPRGFNIIHRLPIRSESDSSIVYYRSNFIDYDHQYLFPPINLSQLTVRIYMDGEELPRDNLTISFEFELTILNK